MGLESVYSFWLCAVKSKYTVEHIIVCKWVGFQNVSMAVSYQRYINCCDAHSHFLFFTLSDSCPFTVSFTSGFYLSRISVSIFYLFPLSVLLSLPAASVWMRFLLSSSLHNCLDKSRIDCTCWLELISLCTVFSFLFGSSRCDEHFSVSIHQNDSLDVACFSPWEQKDCVKPYEQEKNWR